MNKQHSLDIIAKEIALCAVCKIGKSGVAVAGEGNADAEIVFLGEAPGKQEAKIGRPFIGRSGKLLRELIREVGLLEDEVYITSPVKYLPDRGTPTKADIAHGRTHLAQQLAVIEPKVIVLLGASACFAMLNRVVPIMKERGTTLKQDGRMYFITLHPSAGLRFPKLKILLREDFEKLRTFL